MDEYSFKVFCPSGQDDELEHFASFTAHPIDAAAILESIGAYWSGDVARIQIVGGETWEGALNQSYNGTDFDQFLDRVRVL